MEMLTTTTHSRFWSGQTMGSSCKKGVKESTTGSPTAQHVSERRAKGRHREVMCVCYVPAVSECARVVCIFERCAGCIFIWARPLPLSAPSSAAYAHTRRALLSYTRPSSTRAQAHMRAGLCEERATPQADLDRASVPACALGAAGAPYQVELNHFAQDVLEGDRARLAEAVALLVGPHTGFLGRCN